MMSSSHADNLATSLDTLAGLLRVIAKPEEAAKLVADLSTSVAEMRDIATKIAASKDETKAQLDSLIEAKRELTKAQADANAARDEAIAQAAEVGQASVALAHDRAAHEAQTAKDLALIRTERDAFMGQKTAHDRDRNAFEAESMKRAAELDQREEALKKRENVISAREAAAQEILDRVAVLGERAKKAS